MMGQDVGFRVFLAGKNYSVLDFGRDDEREDTRAEFKPREEVSTPPKESPALVEPELDGNTKPLVPDTINWAEWNCYRVISNMDRISACVTER